MKINELVSESLGDDFAAFAKDLQKNNPKFKNLRVHGDPEHDELRRQDAEARAKRLAQPAAAPKELSPEERHKLEQELGHLEAQFDPYYQYSDDHSVYTKHHGLAQRINSIKHRLKQGVAESATVGATSSANIGTVVSPQLSPGKARGKKSYTGSVATGSGTKAPPQPKVNQPKNKDGTAKNGLDIKGTSLFGGPAVKRG
jgi:hypothetical protein